MSMGLCDRSFLNDWRFSNWPIKEKESSSESPPRLVESATVQVLIRATRQMVRKIKCNSMFCVVVFPFFIEKVSFRFDFLFFFGGGGNKVSMAAPLNLPSTVESWVSSEGMNDPAMGSYSLSFEGDAHAPETSFDAVDHFSPTPGRAPLAVCLWAGLLLP